MKHHRQKSIAAKSSLLEAVKSAGSFLYIICMFFYVMFFYVCRKQLFWYRFLLDMDHLVIIFNVIELMVGMWVIFDVNA